MKDVIAKTLCNSLGEGYKIKNLKHNLTIVKDIDEHTTVKLTHFKKLKQTVTVCVSKKKLNNVDLVNHIKFDVDYGEINKVISELLDYANSK